VSTTGEATSLRHAGGLARPPAAGSRARRTYDRLLDATERLLASGGYPAATSTAIAGEAGVSTGSFYTYFDDREDVLAAALHRRLALLLDLVAEELTPGALLDDGLPAVLERALDATLEEYRSHSPTYRAALAQVPASDLIRSVYWAAHRATEEVVTTFIRRAQAAGRARSDADPRVLALTLLVVVQGANHPLLLDGDDATAERIRSELLDLLLHLVGTPPREHGGARTVTVSGPGGREPT
jgi:AcrR family transcriptional regulator